MIFFVKVCNDTVNIFIKHYMINFNISLKFHCWDLKVPVVAETPERVFASKRGDAALSAECEGLETCF